MGRFKHEAVAVDPASGAVYLTEDRHDGCIYRYLPKVADRLVEGGRLQALAIAGHSSLDTRNWHAKRDVEIGDRLALDWIDLEDVEPADDSLREQAFKRGAALFARGEGMWRGADGIYFACTIGGSRRLGQIWRLRPSGRTGGAGERSEPATLELFVEPNNATVVENADNITVAPWGDLIVCEDGPGQQFLLGITPAGDIYKLARNALNGSEFAGATFSPDASTLFVNIQHPHGLTLAITGPWKRS
jgi:secreted PhoX family phosphatase